MGSTFEFNDVDSAIQKLQDLKKENKNGKIVICTIDFDNDKESRKVATPDEGCVLVRKSKTIIINEDTFIPHMELYSTKQTDLENIIKTGVMHDIIFGFDKSWLLDSN